MFVYCLFVNFGFQYEHFSFDNNVCTIITINCFQKPPFCYKFFKTIKNVSHNKDLTISRCTKQTFMHTKMQILIVFFLGLTIIGTSKSIPVKVNGNVSVTLYDGGKSSNFSNKIIYVPVFCIENKIYEHYILLFVYL